ncbi:Mediator of RNA polymerase II transcription subunit 13 [Pseudozyma hubeiensis]|nr:Mediator of RNA polymerase II transcription subunit 13 [Pseudozyma hubeiensis]
MTHNATAHRRVAGINQPQHASSPSSSSSFPRPFSNVAFPGTVSAPRSAAAPNTPSAPPKSLQRLPILTANTPTSIAKLAFPPHTTIFWHRLRPVTPDTVSDQSLDQQRADGSAFTTSTSSTSHQEAREAWSTAVHHIVTAARQSTLQSHATDASLSGNEEPLQPLLQAPLIHATSRPSSSRSDAHLASSGPTSDLWLFVGVTDQSELSSGNALNGVTDDAANVAIKDLTTNDDTSKASNSSMLLHPAIARLVSPDLLKSLARVSPSAHATSGSYRLAAASVDATNGKGKLSSLSSDQRQAHKRFMSSLRARLTDSLASASTPSPSTQQLHATKSASRARLRLGDSIVFLPHPPSRSSKKAISDAAWFAAPGQPNALRDGDDGSLSLLVRTTLSLTPSSLFVRGNSCRLAAVPLLDTRHSNFSSSLPSTLPHPKVVIAPLDRQVDLIGMVPPSSFAEEHFAELASRFASLNVVPQHQEEDMQSVLASGLAVCAPPRSEAQPNDQLSRAQAPRQLQVVSSVTAVRSETTNESMPFAFTTENHEHAHSDPSHLVSGPNRFLWPAAWCLVLSDRRIAATRASCTDDLQIAQSQPMTPLKELVAFTLKVLNDANEASHAQSTAAYTPNDPEDASLSLHRADRLPSTRPDITPASITFADFDFAMPTVASATSSHTLPATGQYVTGTSPLKRDPMPSEPGPAASNNNAFGQDLSWMQFLPPQTSNATASASASTSAMRVSAANSPTLGAANAKNSGLDGAQPSQLVQRDSDWLPSTDSASSRDAQTNDQPRDLVDPQALLPSHTDLRSHSSMAMQNIQGTHLAPTQSTSTKRKAGEGDIFDNLDLLTEDDFSFFDESAFGLHPGEALSEQIDQSALSSHVAPTQELGYDQRLITENASSAPASSLVAGSQPIAASGAAAIDDVAMDDVGQSSLDALFSAIPGLQHAMASTEMPHAQHAVPQATSSAATATQAAHLQIGHGASHDMVAASTGTTHPFSSAMSSFTPRDPGGATPFGDPASLPGFTPSSLTESSPAFGNPQYKTPRTPYSPVEEYRDGATIVDLQNSNRFQEGAPSARDRNTGSATEAQAINKYPLAKSEAEDQLRLADASTAAAAAAHAAMELDPSTRKRLAIVPNAFLPISQPESRKPLQRLAAGARANLGRKYDLLGKFASRPKTATASATTSHANNVAIPERRFSGDVSRTADRVDRESAPESDCAGTQSLTPHPGLSATRPSPSKTPSGRGQALLQLRRDRRGKPSPASTLITLRRSSSSRATEGPATPRSSDDFAPSGAISGTDSDTSSSGDDESDDASSDTEATVMTLSPADQATLKASSLDIISAYLSGGLRSSRSHWLGALFDAQDHCSSDRSHLAQPNAPRPPLQGDTRTDLTIGTVAASRRFSVRRWMLSRTAEWLIQNPQFRSMYCASSAAKTTWPDTAIGDKIELLQSMASALNIAPTSDAFKPPSDKDSATIKADTQVAAVPTLKSLVRLRGAAANAVIADGSCSEVAEVLEPARIAVGCQGSVVEALPSALNLWDKSKLSAVSGQKHVVAKVLLTDASPAWHEEIVAWLDRLRAAFETHGLGTHVGGAQSILAVADGSESLPLSSYLDQLWTDGETWLDTLRSISSRVQFDLLQGKHVVVYTLQPSNSTACGSTGFHGLLRFERDLRAMLSEQVGVLAEQLLVRVVSPSMMTESGSLGFGQQMQMVRRLAFSVYDQLARLVRRQPAKVLHGKEPGPISAVVQFPAFSLSTGSETSSAASSTAAKAGRTSFSLSWPQEPAAVTDERVMLHVGYRICQASSGEEAAGAQMGDKTPSRNGSAASIDAAGMFGLDKAVDAEDRDSSKQESVVTVSAIDERGGSSSVDALAATDGDSSIEACVERVWRFAVGEASRARVQWRLIISSTGPMSRREKQAWERLIEAYWASTMAGDRVMGSVMLVSARPDESGAILAERGVRAKVNQEWPGTALTDKSSLMLLDAADFSQTVKFAGPMPMGWTQAMDGAETSDEGSDDGEEDKLDEETAAMPIASAILMHHPRPESSNGGGNAGGRGHEVIGKHRLHGSTSTSHVMAVDLLQVWPPHATLRTDAQEKEAEDAAESANSEAMDAILRSLHRLRLISQERHQLPWPYSAQPWPVASVNALAACVEGVVLRD